MKRGIVSEERIDDACRRVLELKEKVGLFDPDYARDSVKIEDVQPLTRAVCQKIADNGVTLLRNRTNILPLRQDVKRVTIYTFTHKESIFHSLKAMKEAFEERGIAVDLRRRPENYGDVAKAAQDSDLIIYAGYIGHFAPKGMPSFYDEEFWSLRYAFTAGKEKSIGVSLGFPFIHHFFMDDADTFINLYTPHECAQRAFVNGLFQENGFPGVPPLDMTTGCEDDD